MSAPYKEAKPGRLVFKGGEAASLAKKKHKKNKSKPKPSDEGLPEGATPADPSDGTSNKAVEGGGGAGEGDVYTIDAAKKMKYEELFPVEAKKFKYDPKNASRIVARTVEESLDDRVRKKADRYCK